MRMRTHTGNLHPAASLPHLIPWVLLIPSNLQFLADVRCFD